MEIVDRLVKNRYELASFLVHHDDFLVAITYSLLQIRSASENLRPIPVIITVIHQLCYQADFFLDLIMMSEVGLVWLKRFLDQLVSEDYDCTKALITEISLHSTDIGTSRPRQQIDYPKPTRPLNIIIKTGNEQSTVTLTGLKGADAIPPKKAKVDPDAFYSFMGSLYSRFSSQMESSSRTKSIYSLFNVWFSRCKNN